LIKAIIFDLSEVYLKGIIGAEHYMGPLLGIKPKDIRPMLRGDNLRSLFLGKITEDEYWKRTIEKHGWNVDVKTLKKVARKNFAEISGTREIIVKLREQGFIIGLLSDHAREWIEYLSKKFGYHKLFHSTLYSFEAGSCKPDKKIYGLMLAKLKIKPDECVFVDDKEKNLVPAKELGMKTIRFENAEQLKMELARLSIGVD